MSAFAGTGRLARLAFRRDRVRTLSWVVALGVLTGASVASVVGLYATEEERIGAVTFLAANPVSRVFDGPASGTHLGTIAMGEIFILLAILTALMSAQAVVRHTRDDEQAGRAELLGSAVVGRYAPVTAALLLAVVASSCVGAAITVAMIANGLGGIGAVVSGAALAGVGITFAGVAAVTAQVFSTSRGASAANGAALGVAFLLRAVGDAFGEVDATGLRLVSAWPSWLSPLGWGQQMRPYDENDLALLWLFAGLTALLVAARTGPPTAPRALRSPLGLAWRLQRGIFAAWAVGLVLVGLAFGAVGESAEEVVGLSDQLEHALQAMAPGGGLLDLYFTFVVGFLGVASAGFTVQSVLRMRAEEASGRLEPVLATATGRITWMASHVAIAVVGTVVLLGLLGAAGAVAYGAVSGRWAVGFEGMAVGALVQAPAALTIGGFALAAFGAVPRWTSALAWTALAVSLVLGQLGALLDLPQSVLNLSPFSHLPAVPAQPFALAPVVLLLTVAMLLAALGVALFRRRDLAIGA